MKKILILVILTLTLAVFASACGDKDVDNTSVEFTGFEVSESVTAESGTYYDFETPEVKVGEETVNLIIVVKNGEKLIPHDGFKVYLDKVGTFTVTYKAMFDGVTEEKTTKVTTEDTTAPVIKSTLSGAFKYGTTVNVFDYIRVNDVSKTDAPTVTVTKLDGTALPDGSFNATTGKLTVTDESIRKVKVSVSAKDEYDNAATGSFEIPFTPAPTYGAFDFDWFETNSTEISGVKVSLNQNNSYQMKIEEESGEKYLNISITTTAINQYVTVFFPESLIGDYANFDYFEIEMQLSCSYNGGNGGLTGAEFTARPVGTTENMFTYKKGQWYTYRYQGSAARDSIEKSGGISLLFKPWGAQDITIKIKDIVGSYEQRSFFSDGNSVFDFEQVLGLSSSDVKNVTFGGTAVTDLTTFKPKTSGELTFTYCKNGYKETVVSVNLVIGQNPLDDNNANDNDFTWDW